MSRTKIITLEDVHKLTDGGKMVFEREVGNFTIHKNVSSPLRAGDSNPSFRIYQNNSSIWSFKDYGGGQESGSYITLVMSLYGLSFQQAIDKIWNDFKGNKTNLSRRTFEKKEVKPKKEDFWEIQPKPFTDKHKRYFDKLELDEHWLNQNDIWALEKWAINKRIQKQVDGEEYSFVYVHRDNEGNLDNRYKILRLGKNLDPKLKWRTNVYNNMLWGVHKIPKDCENLWIVKSLKDASIFEKHFGFNCVVTNNESATILLENNYEFLEGLAKTKIIAYGCDFQGWHESYLITHLTGWQYFNTPNNLYDNFEIEDFADVVSNFGVNTLCNLLKKKGYLC